MNECMNECMDAAAEERAEKRARACPEDPQRGTFEGRGRLPRDPFTFVWMDGDQRKESGERWLRVQAFGL